jgi:hypothetical protein
MHCGKRSVSCHHRSGRCSLGLQVSSISWPGIVSQDRALLWRALWRPFTSWDALSSKISKIYDFMKAKLISIVTTEILVMLIRQDLRAASLVYALDSLPQPQLAHPAPSENWFQLVLKRLFWPSDWECAFPRSEDLLKQPNHHRQVGLCWSLESESKKAKNWSKYLAKPRWVDSISLIRTIWC